VNPYKLIVPELVLTVTRQTTLGIFVVYSLVCFLTLTHSLTHSHTHTHTHTHTQTHTHTHTHTHHFSNVIVSPVSGVEDAKCIARRKGNTASNLQRKYDVSLLI